MAKRPQQSSGRAREINEMNKAGAEFVDILQQMTAAMKEIQKSAGDTAGEMKYMGNTTSEAAKLAERMSTLSSTDLANKRKRNAFEEAYVRAKREQNNIADKIADKEKEIAAILAKDAKGAKGRAKIADNKLNLIRDQLDASRELTKEAAKYTKTVRNVEKAAGVFGGIADMLGQIPIIGPVFKEFATASKAMADSMAQGKSMAYGIAEGLKGIAKAGLMLLIGAAIAGFGKLQKEIAGLRRSLALTNEDSGKMFGRIRSAAAGMSMTIGDATKAMSGFNQTLHTSAVASAETQGYVLGISERLGLGAENAAKLYKHAASSGKSLKEVTDETLGFVKNFEKGNKVFLNGAQILEDVATASATTALTTKQFPGGLKKAAAEARKLGTDLAKSEASMSSMLDFQSSIEKEMEAELLLGRDLNLDRARSAALMGDITTFNKEIAKQGITAASFGKMDMLTKEATAAALGKSAEELAGMLKSEEGLKSISEEAIANGQSLSDSKKTDQELGEEMFNIIARQATVSEQMATMWENFQLALGSIVQDHMPAISEALKGITEWLKDPENIDKLISGLKTAAFVLAGMSAINLISGINSAITLTKSLWGGLSKAGSAIGNMTGMTGPGAKAGGGAWGGIKNFFGKVGTKMKGGIGAAVDWGKATAAKGGNFLKGLSPGKALQGAISKAGGIKKVIGKFLKVGPIAGALEGLFAYNDIQAMISGGMTGDALMSGIGGRAYDVIGAVLGSIGGSALGSIIPGIGTLIGGIVGGLGGPWLMRKVAGLFDEDFTAMGSVVAKAPFFNTDGPPIGEMQESMNVEDFTIRPLGKDTLTMAGGTKLGGNVELLLQELIGIVKEGNVINLDGRKVGEGLVMGATRL